MIPLRLALRALSYVLEGRASWLEAKSWDNADKAAGRRREARKLRSQAAAVGKMSQDAGPLSIDASLMGLMLARAVGELETGKQLREAMRYGAPAAAAPVLAELVALGVLPEPRAGG
jgi:hypothetical protein